MSLNFENGNLAKFIERSLRGGAEVVNPRRLTGGANMETWAFGYEGNEYILRLQPEGSDAGPTFARIDLSIEADLIDRVQKHGVLAPRVFGTLRPEDNAGIGFLMEKVSGEALPHKLLKDPKYENALEKLPLQCAAELAKIHAINSRDIPASIPTQSAEQKIAFQRSLFEKFEADSPIVSLAFEWLEQNVPSTEECTLVHGDFRMGNILVDQSGITAVLDWELAHRGDPAHDLAYICTPSWRFGNYEKPVGGFGQIEEFLAAYESASGRKVEESRFNFWLVYCTLNWAIGTLIMIDMWRRGIDRTIERTVIGTRFSETEIDLLLLLEDIVFDTAPTNNLKSPPLGKSEMKGDTHLSELLLATQEWVNSSIIPNADDRMLFESRVARKAIGIALRKEQFGPDFNARRTQRLNTLGLNQAGLITGIANGTVDLRTDGILDHLRMTALEDVMIDQPKYAGLKAAQHKWLAD